MSNESLAILVSRIDAEERRIDSNERRMDAMAETLDAHVRSCEKMQKRVLIVAALILTWLIVHSPEVAKTVSAMLDWAKP